MHGIRTAAFTIVISIFFATSLTAAPLEVINSGPRGEIEQIEEANEIRIVFSEPMVVLGRIPDPVRAPFVSITPSISGTFRWSGTTTLIFTPSRPLPFATTYAVTVSTEAESLAGNRLASPHRVSFTTPTVKLLRTAWYRKNDQWNGPVVIGLYLNQPVPRDRFPDHVKTELSPHDWNAPSISPAARKRMPAKALEQFEAKAAKARQAAQSSKPVRAFLTDEWDGTRFGADENLIVLETEPGVPPDAWIRVTLSPQIASASGPAVPGHEQHYTIQLNPHFFVDDFRCTDDCDPERRHVVSFRVPVPWQDLRDAATVTDITDPKAPRKLERSEDNDERSWPTTYASLPDLGYEQEPNRVYEMRLDPTLEASNGEPLGFTWVGVIDLAHARAYTQFGDGHGVWERKGGSVVPFYARNMKKVRQWIAPLEEQELVPTLAKLQESNFQIKPDAQPVDRTLPVTPNEIQSHGLDVSQWLDEGTGIVWAAIEELEPIPGTVTYDRRDLTSTVIQVTDLGITAKSSLQNTLVFVTRLSTGAPVPGATVRLRDTANKLLWTGTTDAQGIATGPGVSNENWWNLRFVVTADKDGDLAYIGSDWHEGILSWDFGLSYGYDEAGPLLRGTVFSDRGVYKPGEEVHFKAIVRSDIPDEMKPLDAGTPLTIRLLDSRGSAVDEREVRLNHWSSAEWTFDLPAEAHLGGYSIEGSVANQSGTIYGSFLVAAYRRPDFRVDVEISGDSDIAGTNLDGSASGRYLFGAPMAGRDVRWTYSKSPWYSVPTAIRDRFPEQTFHFVGSPWNLERSFESGVISQQEESLDGEGLLSLELPTKLDAEVPYQYNLEAEVTDVSRQRIANRNSFVVHPAPWYVGFKPVPYFIRAEEGLQTEIITPAPDGSLVSGVEVELNLKQIQWHSVRRGEGSGFYAWETERREIELGSRTVTSSDIPVPVQLDIPEGGYYLLTATARDAEGRSTISWDSFYALGAGYTAWQRFDHNRIELIPEKAVYRPGETARIMIKSPWETATGLLTVEREGVKWHRRFDLTSTQQTIEVPITENEIPNTFVSVLLIKGRTSDVLDAEGADPGKPAFRLGYVALEVVDDLKRLDVEVTANREEFRPASEAEVSVVVRDQAGRPARAEVTLWAVDYGVLSLTNYAPPDVAGSVWVYKSLQVLNTDSRQRIISRRVLTPKGADEGGGGGDPGAIRKDFRVLAFWLGSLETDENGRITTTAKLPESLTTYKIMAVAADRDSRFGSATAEIRINKPVLLSAAFPRFLALGDEALFGAVVHSQLTRGGRAAITMESLDPQILEITSDKRQRVQIPKQGSQEVRFNVRAKSVGNARVRMTVSLRGETDAFEDVIPVEILVSPEVVAAYGETDARAEEAIQLPTGVLPSVGGLHVELSSTAMVGLSEGARYLIEYPYGCAEQRSSRTIALLLATDLGEAFPLEGIEPSELRPRVQSSLRELEAFQCDDGGFAYWKGQCQATSPYLTSYIVHIYQQAQKLGYGVDTNGLEQAYGYLERALSTEPPVNDGWRPAYTAWQTYAVKVLTEGGRNQDSNINRLYGFLDRMPVFAISYLWDAMVAKGERSGARVDELKRRITNSILPEGGSAHVEELSDPHLLWFWNSNVRSTAIALRSLVNNSDDRALVRPMVRWMMEVREDGRWGNTQENALAMEALVAYYRKYESVVPDFSATVSLGAQSLVEEEFRGRSTEAAVSAVPMASLASKLRTTEQVPLVFSKQGPGTLFYLTRLKYAPSDLMLQGLDRGFRVERSYASKDDPETPKTTFDAGELVRVTLRITIPKERRWVAVSDPIPAGLEPVESMFATTASDLAEEQSSYDSGGDWFSWWQRGGFDHIERHDDRVDLFATRLSEGTHEYSYIARATTVGTFRTAPTHAEEMYEPEVFGRTATDVVEVRK